MATGTITLNGTTSYATIVAAQYGLYCVRVQTFVGHVFSWMPLA